MTYPQSILVANRGEIAARIFRTAREMGIRSIALYADPDRGATWTKLADDAYALPGTTSAQTYLNGPAIIEIAQRAGAHAIHSGYGFLSEDPEFAQQVIDAGMTWIGPSPQAISTLGNKSQARRLATKLGVGLIPGTQDAIRNQKQIVQFAREAEFPILLKNPTGGGGRGILELRSDHEVEALWKDHGLAPADELPPDHALSQFFIEKRLIAARHIETQCLRDQHGNFWMASTRDCSVQRRNQKLIEEAPAPALPQATLDLLQQWSQELFTAVDYVGAGTCEFLVDHNNTPYFLEVNPRLQVEHTVTEEVTGTDLVRLQIAIAFGANLNEIAPVTMAPRGHSLQMRITSEDPNRHLMPSAGTVTEIEWPKGPGIRIEAALAPGENIPVAFDSMIAKIIVWAPTRQQLIARSLRALGELQITGVACSAPLYEHILSGTAFADPVGGKVHTRWLEETQLGDFEADNLSTSAQPEGSESRQPVLSEEYDIEIDGRRHRIRLPRELFANFTQRPVPDLGRAQIVRRGRRASQLNQTHIDDPRTVRAPMQATVIRLAVTPGDVVEAGDLIAVIEAMKMEQPLSAPMSGVVSDICVAVGDSVNSDQVLVTLSTREEKDES
ncbi:ATP-binding protein [Arcanobacterium buesumense]|uniref:ATP-binding protein n=1 Tax=Arcanobacterium buesumense TaxID=2722751 RepID=UPI001FFCDB93|nr:biotin carboxylase N-terminal domain-containing protein [Arcanobacterium buesumense]